MTDPHTINRARLVADMTSAVVRLAGQTRMDATDPDVLDAIAEMLETRVDDDAIWSELRDMVRRERRNRSGHDRPVKLPSAATRAALIENVRGLARHNRKVGTNDAD